MSLIDNVDEARALAEKLADELLADADAEQLEQARQMGMVLSLFHEQVEAARARFNNQTAPNLTGRDEIFEKVVCGRLQGA